jgi:hypothetical protein
MFTIRGVGTGWGGVFFVFFPPPPPPPKFQRTKSALFCDMKSALFVQANVAVNTKLTSKMPFLFGNFQAFL